LAVFALVSGTEEIDFKDTNQTSTIQCYLPAVIPFNEFQCHNVSFVTFRRSLSNRAEDAEGVEPVRAALLPSHVVLPLSAGGGRCRGAGEEPTGCRAAAVPGCAGSAGHPTDALGALGGLRTFHALTCRQR